MKIITHLILSFIVCLPTYAQQELALIIGIDKYSPPQNQKASSLTGRTQWPDLDGCKNDAMAMKNEIVAKWGFTNSNIRELYDNNATRKNILFEIDQLLQKTKKGDIVFVFYAGHGSQVKNTKSAEPDKLDESMVPADAWKGEEDIRDKTLALRINRFIDKGVFLTMIYDCCHSGSIGRGFNNEPPKFRYLKAANYDVMDASNPPVPELRKQSSYLSISASQEDEPAQEQKDDNNIPHGAFTIAFIKALNQQGQDASVINIFNATRAILKSNGKNQEPVLAGSLQRQQGTLFGLGKGTLPDKILIPLIAIRDGILEFQGGFMLGLNVNNELKKTNTNVQVRITSMLGANRCAGKVISGNINNLKPGELFEVSNWVSSAAPFLKIHVPNSTLSFEEVKQISKICSQVKLKHSVKWISNLEKQDPDIYIYYRKNSWFANDFQKGSISPIVLSSDNINNLAKGKYVYINIPPPRILHDTLKKAFDALKNIQIVSDANDAQYYLAGNINDNNQLSYGLVRSQSVAADSLESMPLQTSYYEISSNTKENLNLLKDGIFENALRLSKVRAWLNLQAPHSNNYFPFHLQLRNSSSNQSVVNNGVKVGDRLLICLVADDNYAVKWDRKKRFVYVFLIDRNGKMSLVYPDENSGNINNQYPQLDENRRVVLVNNLIEGEIAEPVGTDNYFLLATEDPIPGYVQTFNHEGVRGNEAVGSDNPLKGLINFANPSTRGFHKPVPGNWNLERVPLKTHH